MGMTLIGETIEFVRDLSPDLHEAAMTAVKAHKRSGEVEVLAVILKSVNFHTANLAGGGWRRSLGWEDNLAHYRWLVQNINEDGINQFRTYMAELTKKPKGAPVVLPDTLDDALDMVGDPIAETERREAAERARREKERKAEEKRLKELEEEKRRLAPENVYDNWGEF